MSIHEFFDAMGIKAGVVIAGLAGGTLRALSRRRYTAREMIASPICGALAAAYLTEPALFYLRAINWPMPMADVAAMNATAFVVGVCAMWISDLIFEAMLRWMKGGQPAP
ncbi:hypothetical protein G6M04_16360 [Agrobacterium rhizogenes]|jgi:hypothetical protein|uniref:hypothetical protein n=1 Tax=Rhizobium rhizogenes TaxID=359 RepID=UPI001572461D|nr:hypothetical protein [Rhizobium rhizogenes]NTG48952.1 hypothetical protein [Rhizobium rhizogenes]NTI92300.1 hypothetical protein [Rhizobium rhizogenes]